MWNPFRRDEHECHAMPIAVQHSDVGDTPRVSFGPFPVPSNEGAVRAPHTIVLVRCECGRFGSQVIRGHWTLDELYGVTPKDAVERLVSG